MSYNQFMALVLFLSSGIIYVVMAAFIPEPLGEIVGFVILLAMWVVAFNKTKN
jgi:hypothetical protein